MGDKLSHRENGSGEREGRLEERERGGKQRQRNEEREGKKAQATETLALMIVGL